MVAGVLQDLEVEAAVLVDRADELKVPRVGLNETATGHFQLRPHTGLNDELCVRPLEAVALDKLDTSPSSGMTGDRPAAVGERHRLVEAQRTPATPAPPPPIELSSGEQRRHRLSRGRSPRAWCRRRRSTDDDDTETAL